MEEGTDYGRKGGDTTDPIGKTQQEVWSEVFKKFVPKSFGMKYSQIAKKFSLLTSKTKVSLHQTRLADMTFTLV